MDNRLAQNESDEIVVLYKKCTKCGEVKLATTEYFGVNKRGRFGLRSDCKHCKNKSNREYNKKNKEKRKEQNYNYSHSKSGRIIRMLHKQKRRAILSGNGGSYSTQQWEECLNFFDGCCAYTGVKLGSGVHREHILAINNGGTNYIWNICPSVPSANLSKQDFELEKWYKAQSYFSEERLQKIYKWIKYAKEKYGQAIA